MNRIRFRNEATGNMTRAFVVGYTPDGMNVWLTKNPYAEEVQTFMRPVSSVMFL